MILWGTNEHLGSGVINDVLRLCRSAHIYCFQIQQQYFWQSNQINIPILNGYVPYTPLHLWRRPFYLYYRDQLELKYKSAI